MKITEEQYKKIEKCFPIPRRKATISNLEIINAMLYVLENGCKWRALPSEYGNWHTIYVRINRWAKNGTLQKVFFFMQKEGIIKIDVNIISMDSTCIKVHPDGMGALKKTESSLLEKHEEDGIQRFIWLPHLISMQ